MKVNVRTSEALLYALNAVYKLTQIKNEDIRVLVSHALLLAQGKEHQADSFERVQRARENVHEMLKELE